MIESALSIEVEAHRGQTNKLGLPGEQHRKRFSCSNPAIRQADAMKAVVTMTSRGVITLPAKLRKFLGIRADYQLIAETTPEGLLLRPAVTLPVEMYSVERVREFEESEAELAEVLKRKKTVR